jgi:hypothetical protein
LISSREVRVVPSDRRPLAEKTQEAASQVTNGGFERRPLQEKRLEAVSDGSPAKGDGNRASSPDESEMEPENLDPQQQDRFDIKAKVLPTRYYSPTIRRKLQTRIPVRASIASTYQINPAMLRESNSSDESAVEASRERYPNDLQRERRVSTFSRPPPPMVPAASSLFGRKKVVHFASPVFQKEKTREELNTSKGEAEQQSNQLGHNLSSGEATDSKKLLAVNKLRRVSIAARRTSAQFGQRTTGGAQRVLSTGAERTIKSGVLPPLKPQSQGRRWNQ